MKHWGRWLLFEQLLFVPKNVTLSEKMRLAWLVSIPLALLTSSEVLSCADGPVMSLDTLEKCHLLPERIRSFVEQNVLKAECQLVPVRIPSLFEQNVLKAVGRTQEGSCKVYAGKTTWKTNCLQARSEEHLKHPERWLLFEQLLFLQKHVTLSEKMRLAWLVSIPASCFFDQQALHDKKLKGDICGFLNWDWKIWKQSLSISEHCKKTTHRTTWPSPIFLNLSRASCMCGCVDINWVTVMRAGGRHVNSNLFQWELPACLTKFLCWYIP